MNAETTTEATTPVTTAPAASREERQLVASKTVRNYSIGAAAVGLIPAPLLDLAAMTGVQLKMLHSLSNQYGVEFKEELARSSLVSLLGAALPVTTSGAAISAMKLIPIIGQAAAMVTLPALALASTYAVGKVFIQHFEAGGTFLTFDPEKVREYFEEQFREGKKLAEESKSSNEAA
jgi:uncharacterized protein (DUF697 family)